MAEGGCMIAAVALKLEAMQLDQARSAIAVAQQAPPPSPENPAASAGAILELSAAAQQLLSTRAA
jgi:hypothetical protein